MGKWDLKSLMTDLRYNDRFLASDQSQADGSQDRNVEVSELAAGFEREVSETSHGLSVGDAVRYNGTNWVEATADTTANAEVIGVVTTVIDTDTFAFKQVGSVTTSGLTAGDYYYLQDAGGLGTTAGTVTVPIGLAVSTTELWLVPIAPDTGGASSVTSIDDLSDVDTTTAAPSTDDSFKWDGSNWVPTAKAPVASRVEETVTTVAASGTTYTINCNDGTMWDVTLTGNCTFSFSNVPTGGFGITLVLTQDGTGSRTATWPAAVAWEGGSAPTLSTGANATDIVTMFTPDGGTTWYGFLGGLAFS